MAARLPRWEFSKFPTFKSPRSNASQNGRGASYAVFGGFWPPAYFDITALFVWACSLRSFVLAVSFLLRVKLEPLQLIPKITLLTLPPLRGDIAFAPPFQVWAIARPPAQVYPDQCLGASFEWRSGSVRIALVSRRGVWRCPLFSLRLS